MITAETVTVGRPSREIPKGENLWLIGAFLAVVKRMRKGNALISYGFSEKASGNVRG